ncbi:MULTISPECIES: hypothetical protein [Robiginitalea]|uniref:Uncharacterized protein n=1 Tax=Robiginitalea biformata (strain ATCC BAA-864 / DSM 15991 / KCTC 12146 / HTCC2501) TaxID=313596 RepID=A4CHH2_ROBBH|nr:MULTISPECIES: hypothetical protein [Robiginitalea]EAR16380.1 hypothetical protein RB2501_05760 [Robiginitalea biformata HTCC2501]MDC6353355.1 hypothetical protein [Robiginitalea sp. PM2]MDC6373480.1 hypothetical protein [Robiginitalea sp. SP8]
MSQIDTYLYVLLTYVTLYSLARYAYRKFKNRLTPAEPAEQEMG